MNDAPLKPPPEDLFGQLIRGWRAYVALAFIALASALPGVAKLPVLDRDEARFAQATRQMLETGDFVRIRLQEDERNKKPIGIHWMQAASVSVAETFTHKLNMIWAYRLPSTLGALLATLACFWAGAALMRREAAFCGAALFGACVLMGAEGMIGKTDGALAGFTTLAMAALAQFYAGAVTRPRAMALLFWAAMGAAILIKGPVGPMVAGLAVLAIGFWRRDWSWLKPLGWWAGPVLCVAMVAPWMVGIAIATEGRFFTEAIGEDLAPKLGGGSEGHFAWPGYHLALVSVMIFPATLALPAAVRAGLGALRTRSGEVAPNAAGALQFLIAWAVPAFIVFELAPTKLAHYPLPTYPAIALLGAFGLARALEDKQQIVRWLGVALFALAGAALIGVISYGATFMPGDADAGARRAVQTALTMGVIGVVCLGVIMFVRRLPAQCAAAAVFALSLSFTLRERVLPEADTFLISTRVDAALTRERLLPNDERQLYVTGYGEMSLVFMTRTDIRIRGPQEMAEEIAPGDALVIEGREMDDAMAALDARGLVYNERVAPIEGVNYGNGDDVVMHVGVVSGEAIEKQAPARNAAPK